MSDDDTWCARCRKAIINCCCCSVLCYESEPEEIIQGSPAPTVCLPLSEIPLQTSPSTSSNRQSGMSSQHASPAKSPSTLGEPKNKLTDDEKLAALQNLSSQPTPGPSSSVVDEEQQSRQKRTSRGLRRHLATYEPPTDSESEDERIANQARRRLDVINESPSASVNSSQSPNRAVGSAVTVEEGNTGGEDPPTMVVQEPKEASGPPATESEQETKAEDTKEPENVNKEDVREEMEVEEGKDETSDMGEMSEQEPTEKESEKKKPDDENK